MKLNKIFLVGMMLVAHATASADVIRCQAGDSQDFKQISVRAVGPGVYEFEAFESSNFTMKYYKSGSINRTMLEGKPMMTFEGANLQIFHVFGAYLFVTNAPDHVIGIADSGCVLNPNEGL